MRIFQYDKTFEGILTCVFDAYVRKAFPDCLLAEEEPLPLFYDDLFHSVSDPEKARRVWRGLQRKLSPSAMHELAVCWLADTCPHVDELLFRYMRKALDAPRGVELDFGDADVLELSKLYKQVTGERMRLVQFARFQKTADGTYFAPFEPLYDVLPLAVEHFADRFADQKWLVYDMKRGYGFYYDLQRTRKVSFEQLPEQMEGGFLADELLSEDEKMFQQLWQSYFQATCIRERLNPRKHRQDMPVRYWKYLTEKRSGR